MSGTGYTLVGDDGAYTFREIDVMPRYHGPNNEYLSLVPSTPRYRLARSLSAALRAIGALPSPRAQTITNVDVERGVITIGTPE